MRNYGRLLLVGLTAAIVLAAAVGTASARRIEVSNQSIRAVWETATPLTFTGGGFTTVCPVTLEGSFHSKTISKVSGQLVGYITRAALTKSSCTGPVALILNGIENPGATTLPWHVRYDSFTGPLPAITGIRLQLIGAAFLLEVTELSISCLFISTAAKPAFGIATVNGAGVITGLRADETRAIPRAAGQSILCPGEGNFAGTAAVTLLGATTSVSVRLVQ